MDNVQVVYKVIGRKKLFTDAAEITQKNIVQVISKAFKDHLDNACQEEWLYNYEKGDQPILDKEKDIRPEINNKIVENQASKIVDVHLAYDFSNPLTYVRKTKYEDKGDKTEKDAKVTPLTEEKEAEDAAYVVLNQMMHSVSKPKKDVEMGRLLMVGGVAYKMVLPSRNPNAFAPFDYMIPDPRTTFVVYSNDVYREPMVGCTYSIHDDGTITFTAYTKDRYYKFDRTVNGDFNQNPAVLPNVLGMIPIIEYELPDRMGIFEKVIPIMDALNNINSNRINDIEQHVQSILWMNNAELDEDSKDELLSGRGIIATKSQDGKNANIQYLSQVLDQGQVQTLVSYYNDQILQITSTPSWQEASGGSTTGAMQLSNGWQCLELSAKTIEMMYDESERTFLSLVKACVARKDDKYHGLKNINVADVDIKFNRNKTFDLTSKVNALSTLINAGVYGLDAITTVNLFTDPQVTWENSKKNIDGMQKKLRDDDQASQSKNIIKDSGAGKDDEGNGGSVNTEKTKADESVQPSQVAGVKE